MIIYLDWNVFERLQSREALPEKEKEVYETIAEFLNRRFVHAFYGDYFISLDNDQKSKVEKLNRHITVCTPKEFVKDIT